jgi:predicted MFS family arabinose efflux permease
MVVIGAIETWHVFATALIAGTAMAFNQPVRQALIPTVVPRDDLMNAVALNSAAVSFMRIGGGSIAGVLLIWFSTGGVYLITACIYVFVILTTLLVQADGEASRRSQTGWFADLKDGLNYVASNPTLGLVTLLAGILFIFGFPYQSVFVPLLATRTLGIGDSGVGFLMGATGLGAFAGSIFVAWRSGVSRPGVQLMVNMLVFGLSLVLVALQATVIGTALLLAVAGAMTVTYMAFTNAILLEHSSPEMHGRVMSLLSLDRGLIPLGAIMAGVLVSAIGVRPGVFVMGAVAASMAGLALLFAGRQLASIRGSITDVRSGEGPDTREPPDDGPEAGATIAQPGG